MPTPDLQADHMKLEDTRVTRRYFGEFEKIDQHLTKAMAIMDAEYRSDFTAGMVA